MQSPAPLVAKRVASRARAASPNPNGVEPDAAFGSIAFTPLRRCPPLADQRLLRSVGQASGAHRGLFRNVSRRARGSDKPSQQEHERSLRTTNRIPCRPLLRPHQRVPAEVSPNAELSVTRNWGWLAGIVCHRHGVLDALAQLNYAEVAEKGDERTAWPLYALGT
jgi:hypothetical protein